MTTYNIREFKAGLSEILRDVEAGAEVIIARRGRPFAKLTALGTPNTTKAPLSTLRGALRHRLPDATYQDFLDAKAVWEPKPLPRD